MAKQRHAVKNLPLPVYVTQLPEETLTQGDVTVIVPSDAVLLTTVSLPKGSGHRLKQALPYALEEQLIEDVTQLHFATDKKNPDGTWPVAVVAQAKMQAWLETIQSRGGAPSRMVPDILTLPCLPGQWTLDLDETTCVVRTGRFSGFACHRDNLSTFLETAFAEAASPPEALQVRFLTDNTHLPLPAGLMIPVNTSQLDPGLRARTAADVMAKEPVINLLQDAFKPRHTDRATRRLWQAALGITTAAITLLFVTQAIALIALQRESAQLQQDIARIYKRHFPAATAVVAPKTRLTEKLHKAGSHNQRTAFLELLAHTAEPLAMASGTLVEWMDYHNQQLRLGISAPSFESLNDLTQALHAAGLDIKSQRATTAATGQVKATLLIRSPA